MNNNKRAVVVIGGRQYIVATGDRVNTETQPGKAGEQLSLDSVLLVSDDKSVQIGTPYVSGAKVSAEIIAQKRARKIIVQKYKPKSRYHRRQGHRQSYTELKILQVS